MTVKHTEFSTKKPPQLVYLELGNGNGGMLLSISEEGFRFRAVTPVRANGDVPFAFSLDGSYRFEGSGSIEWVEEDGKSGGLRFTEISDEFRSELSKWLNAGSAQTLGREAMPAATEPIDTMERIRQEIRSGYPQRPAPQNSQPHSPQSSKQAPSKELRKEAPDLKPSEPKSKPVVPSPRKPQSVPEEAQPFPAPVPARPRTAESLVGARLFPLPPTSTPPGEDKKLTIGSAFLKPPQDAKPVRTSDHSSPAFTPSPQNSGRSFAQNPPKANILNSAMAIPVATRPHIPPLEESFENAWENAKLNAPAETPHLSRAAAGGIIALALAVILAAVAYNFRQDIGNILVQMGHSISGDTHSASVPAAESTKPDVPADDQQRAQVPSEIQSTDAGNEHKSSAVPPSGPNDGGASTVKPPATQNTAIKPQDTTDTKTEAPDSQTGQEEFNAARDILRGPYRAAEMPKAIDLLWAGVRKGYVPAEVTLADLFRRGEGVDQSCAQAKVLLIAASKKGSTDAKLMLRLMAEKGCD
jgi:hypothetical protein